MGAITPTESPGTVYGQEYLGAKLQKFDVIFSDGQTVVATPAPVGSAPQRKYRPAVFLVGAGASGTVSDGTYSLVSAAGSVGTLFWWGPVALTAGTITSMTAPSAPALTNTTTALSGARHRVFDFASVATGDTFTPGFTGVTDLAFECEATSMIVGYSAGVFTFTVTSGPASNVRLHVWSES